MLRNEDRLLIASAVDGLLPETDAARLRVLLAESLDAAQLYRQLVSDRDRLSRLPKHSAPSRIARNVTLQLKAKANPAGVASQPRLDNSRKWLPYFIAASVVLTVMGGSYLFFNDNPVAKKHPKTPAPAIPVTPEIKPGIQEKEFASNRETLPDPVESDVRKPKEQIADSVSPPPSSIQKPPTIEKSTDVFGASLSGAIPEFERTTAKLPLLISFAEAGQDDQQKRIMDELNQLPAVRIDLFARDLPKSIELMQSVMRSSGYHLGVSGKMMEQLKLKVPMAIAVVTENSSAPELASLIQALAKADAKSASVSRMHIFSASVADSKELKLILGADIGLWKRPQSHTQTKDSGGKPISEGTLGQITNSIKKESKAAIMLTSAPSVLRISPERVPEIKQYFERRIVRSPSDVPAIFVIRSAN
ncbi:MAG: hypothetical protein U0798_19035 [Gemmataceae bacterium]